LNMRVLSNAFTVGQTPEKAGAAMRLPCLM
jgi:hypothetical protein